MQHLGEERSGCNGEEGGLLQKNEGRRGAAAAMREGEGRLGFLKRGVSDAPDALLGNRRLTTKSPIHAPI